MTHACRILLQGVFLQSVFLLGALHAMPVQAGDERIRSIDYDPGKVVRIDGCFGFQTMIQFAPGEKIENVGLGDASRWLVVPNKRADLLFVKPAYVSSHSNMTVATDRRRYNFELVAVASEACRRGRVLYTLQFRYPAEPEPEAGVAAIAGIAATEAEPKPPAPRNSAYTFSGAAGNVPQRVFDDGSRTFFRWEDGSATPAVFAVGADQSEMAVDFTVEGDYLVVPRVAPAFVLRRGNAVAVLFNDAYQMPTLDAASPQPRSAGKRAGDDDRSVRKAIAAWFKDRAEDTP
ncbi:MAG: TrbG/VirB9 family P-type conjugative transfer protein [Thermomonas sp.]|uniref:TrbG/VirB9 family P-type conjugative transfer protein n=1 Tax=Thermomonas sp. TaxID=1971895 RepID=UPI0039E4A23D